MKMNIRNGKYFDGREIIYTFHVIEYQYRGLPHAHLVVRLDDAHDIDDPNREDLIYFFNRHFVAEMPHFEGEEYQNILNTRPVSLIYSNSKSSHKKYCA